LALAASICRKVASNILAFKKSAMLLPNASGLLISQQLLKQTTL